VGDDGTVRPTRRSVDVRGSTLENSALVARTGASALSLTVVDNVALTPSMRRVRLAATELPGLAHRPGQDLMLAVPAGGDRHYRRRYTIRRLDRAAGVVDLDVVLHGDGPGARWARDAAAGDRIEALGPRGKITVDPDARWHLFAGDDSALPATLAMVEALGDGGRATAVLEVGGPGDEQEPDVALGVVVDLRWGHRGDRDPGHPGFLVDALGEVPLPEGPGRAYLAGELAVVAAMRRTLLGRGLDPGQVSSKPYWRKGAANAAQ